MEVVVSSAGDGDAGLELGRSWPSTVIVTTTDGTVLVTTSSDSLDEVVNGWGALVVVDSAAVEAPPTSGRLPKTFKTTESSQQST